MLSHENIKWRCEQAQTYDLMVSQVRNDATNGGFFDVKIQIVSISGTFEMGTSNLVFSYNDAALSTPTLMTAHNFSGGNYSTMTISEPNPQGVSVVSTNIVFPDPAQAGTNVSSSFMDVATIRFTITDMSSTSKIAWRDTSPNSTTILSGNPPQEVSARMMMGLDVSLPVELASFTANVDAGSVLLKWTTASETNNLGFDVERSPDGTEFQKVGFVEGNGTTTIPQQYEFEDDISAPGTYSYRLKQIDFDGAFEYSSIIEATIAGPQDFALEQNYPNPFNPETHIRYEVPVASKVTLAIYNLMGEKIRTLVDEEKPVGQHSVLWDSKDDYGRNVGSGVYFYRMTADNFSKTMKLTLIK